VPPPCFALNESLALAASTAAFQMRIVLAGVSELLPADRAFNTRANTKLSFLCFTPVVRKLLLLFGLQVLLLRRFLGCFFSAAASSTASSP
jgi:hypothetical protein